MLACGAFSEVRAQAFHWPHANASHKVCRWYASARKMAIECSHKLRCPMSSFPTVGLHARSVQRALKEHAPFLWKQLLSVQDLGRLKKMRNTYHVLASPSLILFLKCSLQPVACSMLVKKTFSPDYRLTTVLKFCAGHLCALYLFFAHRWPISTRKGGCD